MPAVRGTFVTASAAISASVFAAALSETQERRATGAAEIEPSENACAPNASFASKTDFSIVCSCALIGAALQGLHPFSLAASLS